MKKINEINNVGYYLVGKSLAYSIDKYLYLLLPNNVNLELGKLCTSHGFRLIDDDVFYQENAPGDILRVSQLGEKKETINASVFLVTMLKAENEIIITREENNKSYLDIINIKTGELKCGLESPLAGYEALINKNIIFSNGKSIFKTDLKLKTLWTIDFNQGEELAGPMHTWGDILIYCTQATDDLRGSYYLQACSLTTGEHLWREEGMTYFHQDSTTGKLFAICNSEFMAVQPSKGIVERYKHTLESDKGLFIHEHLTSYKDGRIYFTTDPVYQGSAFTGAFNTKTYEFEFVYSLNTQSGRHGGAGKPIVKDGKLYVLDSQKTLHIYAL